MGVQVSKFDTDLTTGRAGEICLKERLERNRYEVNLNESKEIEELREWDLKAYKGNRVHTIECKNDIASFRTGNIAFEIGQGSSHKPSCLLSTKADWWCHIMYQGDTVYMALQKTDNLCKYILTDQFYKEYNFKFRFMQCVGDNNADIILVDIPSFLDGFTGKLITLSLEEAKERGMINVLPEQKRCYS